MTQPPDEAAETPSPTSSTPPSAEEPVSSLLDELEGRTLELVTEAEPPDLELAGPPSPDDPTNLSPAQRRAIHYRMQGRSPPWIARRLSLLPDDVLRMLASPEADAYVAALYRLDDLELRKMRRAALRELAKALRAGGRKPTETEMATRIRAAGLLLKASEGARDARPTSRNPITNLFQTYVDAGGKDVVP